jgi:Antitoxin SocA-like, Panacea domain
VALLGEAPRDQLSPAEEELLDGIWREFGGMNQWDLRDYSHTLPEWRDPKGSSLPIDIRDILLAEGFSESEAREVLDTLQAEEFAARLSGA